ncbi:MAG: carbohydrate-binding protein [Roseateles sp.]|uniref:carbohydrate-binding protein n=1 Tax=Roseateles sp. TaxID=1971397 RepID=UPI004036CE43
MTTPLRIVNPLPVTDSVLVATDVPEDSTSAWSGATTYNVGDRVHLVGTHKVYESVAASNLNNNPATEPEWVEVGPTNRWAMFDRSNSTQTAQSTSFYYRLQPTAAYNVVALLGLTGALTLRVRVTHGSLGLLYDQTIDLTSLPAQSGWWEWFYGERRGPTLALVDVPGIIGAELRVDVTGTTQLAAGVLLFGQAKDIGILVQQGARVGIQDYSRKETNDFGDVVLVQRAFAKRASYDLPIRAELVDEAVSFLASIRATPCLFIAPKYESAVVYGFYKEFDVNIAYHSVSECSLQVEGLT